MIPEDSKEPYSLTSEDIQMKLDKIDEIEAKLIRLENRQIQADKRIQKIQSNINRLQEQKKE